MPIVTVSGQVGAGAREAGRLAAQQLGIDYVDQEILVQAASTLGVPMESVVPFDERTASRGERIASMLRRFFESSAAAGAAEPMLGSGGLDILLSRTYSEAAADEGLHEVSSERYLDTLSGIVNDLAAHGNVLIIGRGSQVILTDCPGALHVLLVAPLEHRIAFIAEREELSKEAAAKRVHDGDKGRAAFHHKFFKIDVDHPAHYHLTLNSARFSLDEAAQLIGDAARRVASRAAPAARSPDG
ncbi:MAG: cytidylate kinase-like family protein [Dehalococcoidia bacterium]